MQDTESSSQPHWLDPIIDAYKKDVDRTLLRENLKLTPAQRVANLQSFVRGLAEMRRAMRKSQAK